MASEIESIIDDIEKYIDECKYKAFSNTDIIVNRDEMESFISALKSKTPEEIKKYQRIISNRESILADARKKADQIIKDAEVQTTELVSEHQIMQQAYAQANDVVNLASNQAREMIDKATTEANEIRSSAIAYTDSLLNSVQDILVNAIDTTKAQNDSFINTMQSYLNTVKENRMELSPNPIETVMNSSAPQSIPNEAASESAIEKLSRKNSSSDSGNGDAIVLDENLFDKN